MKREDIGESLGRLAFCFFFRYSRFEFALKKLPEKYRPRQQSRAELAKVLRRMGREVYDFGAGRSAHRCPSQVSGRRT